MFTSTIVANRCDEKGNLGIKMRGNATVIWIPTGSEFHDVSGNPETLFYGKASYSISQSVDAQPGDVVVITHASGTPGFLHLDVVTRTGASQHFVTALGKVLITDVPNHGAVGLPDSHLGLDALGKRYMDRLFTIAKKDFHPLQSKHFFASAAGDDKFDELVKTLSSLGPDPKKEAEKGVAPANSRLSTTPVVPVEVPAETKKDIPENLRKLSRAQGALSLYSNIWSIAMRQKRGHPEPYKISDPAEASQVNADNADSTTACLTGVLAGFFTKSDGKQDKMDKEMFSTEIHLEFLSTMFDGFGFQPDKLKELDGVLTSVVQTLSSLNVSSASASSEVNHVMLTRGVREISFQNEKGDFEVVAYEPIIRLTYMHVAQSSWSVSIGKSSAEKVHFEMNYEDDIYVLNADIFDEHTPDLDAVMNKLIGKNMEDFGNGIVYASAQGQLKETA